jgi:hypothetical protein
VVADITGVDELVVEMEVSTDEVDVNEIVVVETVDTTVDV